LGIEAFDIVSVFYSPLRVKRAHEL